MIWLVILPSCQRVPLPAQVDVLIDETAIELFRLISHFEALRDVPRINDHRDRRSIPIDADEVVTRVGYETTVIVGLF